jgi:hypothetical protein
MEQFLSVLTNNVSEIVQYALMGVVYFLVVLFKSKVDVAKRDMTLAFNDKCTNAMQSANNAEQIYKKTVEENRALKARVERLEKAMIELLREDTEGLEEAYNVGKLCNDQET